MLSVNIELGRGSYAVAEGALQGYLLPMLDLSTHQTQLELANTGRAGLGLGTRL